MLAEHKRLSEKIKEITVQIESLPQGSLICTRNKNYFKWYNKNKSSLKYLSKENQKTAEKLALKTYLKSLKADLLQEHAAVESYLNKHKEQLKSQTILNHPEYRRLISLNYPDLNNELKEWAASDYPRNMRNPEMLIHTSLSGHMLRSKSEATIDMLLYINAIPFRYENEIDLDGIKIYPDFTIRNPKTGEYFYWEHFGMMDNPKYIQNTTSKIQTYSMNNIIPTVNLIMTFETKAQPLSAEYVSKLIEYYFL